MNYRPITDVWILGRSKTKDPETGKSYYGAYLSGFLERARPMLVGGNHAFCMCAADMHAATTAKKGASRCPGSGKTI